MYVDTGNSCSLPQILKRKRGFNLVEAAIVLGVVGLVIGGIWVAASAVTNNLKITDTKKAILSISQGARNLFAGHCAPTGNITEDLDRAGIIPAATYNPSLYEITLPWGSAGMAFILNNGTSCAEELWIELHSLPKAACIDLVSSLSSAMKAEVISIDVAADTGTTFTNMPVSPVDASGACDSNEQSNFIGFHLHLR